MTILSTIYQESRTDREIIFMTVSDFNPKEREMEKFSLGFRKLPSPRKISHVDPKIIKFGVYSKINVLYYPVYVKI